EGEEALAALGGTAEDAGAADEEQAVGEPGERCGGGGELGREQGRVGGGTGHQRCSISNTAVAMSAGSTCLRPAVAAARGAAVAGVLTWGGIPRLCSKSLSRAGARKGLLAAPTARMRRSTYSAVSRSERGEREERRGMRCGTSTPERRSTSWRRRSASRA